MKAMTVQPAMLFTPAGDPGKVDKIRELRVGAVILDLEDSVAEARKGEAREETATVLSGHSREKEIWVRVNGIDTGHFQEDLEAVVHPCLDGVNLPKVASARDLHIADYLIGRQEQKAGVSRGSIPIMATVETVAGLRALDTIIAATPRLACLCFGAGDFSLDIGLDWPGNDADPAPSETLTNARTQIVLASRAAELLPPHDGAYPRHEDLGGLRREAEHVRALGFGGKHAIHPAQVPVIADVFRPSRIQLERAQRIVRAFDDAEASGNAAIAVDGQLVDYPVAARARQLLMETTEHHAHAFGGCHD